MPISNRPPSLINNPVPESRPGHCNDCGLDYTVTQKDHWMFCEARTCVVCLQSFDSVIPTDACGVRICTACKMDIDAGQFDRDSEEEDEDGAT